MAEAYEFGEYVLEVEERRLMRGGDGVPLAPRTLDLLIALIRRAGSLVTKRDLLDVVWHDACVEEGILSVHVSSLRKALDDGAGGRGYIETVARAGYRFSSTVRRRRADAHRVSWPGPLGALPAQPAVSELVGLGRSHLLTAARSDVLKAVEAFRSAVDLDPSYAPAHAGVALACCAQAELRLASAAQAYDDARKAALRALAMDDANADAQVALGTVLFLGDWNWTGARRSFERALEIAPDHTEALLQYGRVLEAIGHLDEGLAAKRKALERNLHSAAVHLQIALSYWNQRRYDEMIEWASRSLELDPAHLLAREYLAAAYLKKEDADRHMAESLIHARAAGADDELVEKLRHIYEASGRRGIVEFALHNNPSAPPVQLALLNSELGQMDEAFRQVDLAIASRDPALVQIAVAPQWDWLRQDPRFEDRLRQMNLAADPPELIIDVHACRPRQQRGSAVPADRRPG